MQSINLEIQRCFLSTVFVKRGKFLGGLAFGATETSEG